LLLLALAGAASMVWLGRWAARRTALAALALVVLVVAALAIGAAKSSSDTLVGPGASRAAAATQPNVVLIIADTLRADALSCYGNQTTPTPAIDQLAADGILYEKNYSQSSWTRPSIATILTSLYPSQHGAMGKQSILPDRVTTVAEVFRDAGYTTAAFVSNINIAPVFNFQQGFHEYTYLPPDFYFWASDSSARLALYRIARVVRERFFADRLYVSNFYQDALVVTDRTRHWLDGKPKGPFFLLVHYMDPHDPYMEIPYDGYGVARVTNPDPPASRRDEMHRLYQENVGYLDEHLATLWARLKELGLYDNTVIAFAADHGEEFQEHHGWWHGTTLYEEAVHVPLLLKLPHQERAGTRVSEPVRTLDIASTLATAASIKPPSAFMGVDVLSPGFQAQPLFAEEDHEGNVLSSLHVGDWKLITANPDNPRGLRPIELYDLSSDPGEQHDRAASEPGRVTEMSQALAKEEKRLRGRGEAGR
jgi:arylsulfatase A-like enzyme